LVEYFHHCDTKLENSDLGRFSKVRTGRPDHSRTSHFAIGQEHSSWALCTSRGWHFLGLKWTWVTTQYIYFFLNRAKKAVKLPTESHYVEHRLVRTDLTTGEVQLDEHAIACLNKV